jgi:hypothetical protein
MDAEHTFKKKFVKGINCFLKVVGNEKLGGSGGWQMLEDGSGPWRSMSVCFLILSSSSIQSISVSNLLRQIIRRLA